MAQETTVVLIDDLNPDLEAAETVRFGLDGAQYEIDLTAGNAARLRQALAEFITAARRSGGRAAAGRKPAARRTSSDDNADIREWARNNGLQVSDRGRISAEIREKYAAAHTHA